MTFTSIPIVIGAFAIFFGLLNIFARNLMWSWEKTRQSFWGKQVERTGLWDFWQILRGLAMIGFGFFAISMGWNFNG